MAKKDSRRRLLLAAAALLLCAAAVFLLLWLNPNRVYTYQAQTASAAQAAETCPFALITRQEFQLAAELLANENVTAFYPNPGEVDPPARELPTAWADTGTLQIGGQDAQVTSLSVQGLQIIVDYTTPAPDVQTLHRRCILSIDYDGTVSKSSAQYENGEALYIVDNWGNEAFQLMRRHRDLLYFLHDEPAAGGLSCAV